MSFIRIFLSGLLVLTALGAAHTSVAGGSQGSVPENGLAIVADQPGVIPDIEVGEIAQLTMHVKNIANNIIHVDRVVSTTCGCIKGTVSPSELAPGQFAELVLEIETQGARAGKARTQLVAVTPDLRIIGIDGVAEYIVRRDIAFTPSAVDVGDLQPGQDYEAVVEASIQGEKARMKVAFIRTDETIGVVESIVPVNTNGEGVYNYRIRLLGNAPSREGVFTSIQRVEFSPLFGKSRMFGIVLRGRVVGPVLALPSRLMLGVLRKDKPVEKQIVLQARSGQPIVVKAVNVPDWISVEVVRSLRAPDGSVTLNLRLKVEATDRESGIDAIEIACSVGEHEYAARVPFIFVIVKEPGSSG